MRRHRRFAVASLLLLAEACSSSPAAPPNGTCGTGRTSIMSALTPGSRWARASDANAVSHNCVTNGTHVGMLIQWDGASATVVLASRSCDFQVGDIEWVTLNTTSCTIEELQVQQGTGTNARYVTFPITVNTDGTQITVGGGGTTIGDT